MVTVGAIRAARWAMPFMWALAVSSAIAFAANAALISAGAGMSRSPVVVSSASAEQGMSNVNCDMRLRDAQYAVSLGGASAELMSAELMYISILNECIPAR